MTEVPIAPAEDLGSVGVTRAEEKDSRTPGRDAKLAIVSRGHARRSYAAVMRWHGG